jgi:hypothetical protein
MSQFIYPFTLLLPGLVIMNKASITILLMLLCGHIFSNPLVDTKDCVAGEGEGTKGFPPLPSFHANHRNSGFTMKSS